MRFFSFSLFTFFILCQRSPFQQLMTEAELASSGDWVWVPDPTEVFVPARKIKDKGGQMKVHHLSAKVYLRVCCIMLAC